MTDRSLAPAFALGAALVAAVLLERCALKARDPFRKDDASERVPANGQRFSEDDLRAKDDVVGYARLCKQELGLPAVTLPAWNCLDGTEIPTTVEGVAPNAATYKDMITHKVGCDVPSWLGEEPCANYAFVQKRELSADVTAILLCRMRGFSSFKDRAARLKDLQDTPNEATYRAYNTFDSLGMLWTHRASGKTCYFDFVGPSFGSYVPSPDDDHVPDVVDLPEPKPPTDISDGSGKEGFWRKNARGTWRTPKDVAALDNCVRCHDSGPFKASPWIEQVFDVPSNDSSIPYEVVGSAFDLWRTTFPAKAISTAPFKNAHGDEEPQICSTCHRIGAHRTCSTYLGFAIGETPAGTLSELGKSFTHRTWMPPTPTSWHDKSEADLTGLWNSAYKTQVDRLKCCCLTPTATGCTSQDFSHAPIPLPVAGSGPGVCL